jgi:hypothetical protein
MRDPKQEARRIPHGFKDTPDGRIRVFLAHETDGNVDMESGKDYAEATTIAMDYIDKHYPGRSL